MLAKLRRGFTGIEILVLGALIVSLITGTIATSDTAKKFLFKPKASGTSQCSLVGSDNQIGCWCAEGGWQFHCFDPNQPLPEGANADECGTKCKALDTNNAPPPPAPIEQPSQPDNSGICESNGKSCSGIKVGDHCTGGSDYFCTKTGAGANGFASCSCACPAGKTADSHGNCTPPSTTISTPETPKTSSEKCTGKQKPSCNNTTDEIICAGGTWTCEPKESKPETPKTTTSQICTPNSFIGCDDSDRQKKMCNSAGNDYVYISCDFGQKCDYSNKKCSLIQTQTSSLPLCTTLGSDITCRADKAPSGSTTCIGELSGQTQYCCLAGKVIDYTKNSCVDKTATPTTPKIGDPCTAPNGTKLDNDRYCCKGFVQTTSACSTTTTTPTTGSTTPTYCQYIGQYFCSTDRKTQNYCFNPNSPPATTACPNNCDNNTGQCIKTLPVTQTYEACVVNCNENLSCVTDKCSNLLTSAGKPIGDPCYLNFPAYNCSSCPNGSIYIGKVSTLVGSYRCISGKPSFSTSKKEQQTPITDSTNPTKTLDDGILCGTINEGGVSSCNQNCKSPTYYSKGGSLYCGSQTTSSTTNICPANAYRCSKDTLGRTVSQKCKINQGAPSWSIDSTCSDICNSDTGQCNTPTKSCDWFKSCGPGYSCDIPGGFICKLSTTSTTETCITIGQYCSNSEVFKCTKIGDKPQSIKNCPLGCNDTGTDCKSVSTPVSQTSTSNEQVTPKTGYSCNASTKLCDKKGSNCILGTPNCYSTYENCQYDCGRGVIPANPLPPAAETTENYCDGNKLYRRHPNQTTPELLKDCGPIGCNTDTGLCNQPQQAEVQQNVPVFYNGWITTSNRTKCEAKNNCKKDHDEWWCYESKNSCLKIIGVKPPIVEVDFKTCSSSDPCPSYQYCDKGTKWWDLFGVCKPLKSIGETCSKDKECASDFRCTDNKCQPPYPWCPADESSVNCATATFSSSDTRPCTSRDNFTTFVCCPPGQSIWSYPANSEPLNRPYSDKNIAYCIPKTCVHTGFKNGQLVCVDQ